MTLTPDFTDTLDAFVGAAVDRVMTALPGIVQSYDPTTQTVDVLPAVRDRYTDESGELVVESLPVLPSVPVVFPGSGDVSITWPISRGDTVLLVFAQREIGTWHQSDQVSDPLTDQSHHLGDAIAIPGLRSAKRTIANAATSGITIAAPTVRIGGDDASGDVVVQSALNDYMTALGTASPPTGAIGNMTGVHDPAVSALLALQSALQNLNASQGWKAGTTVAKAK